jgi:hypothetical protein
MGDIRFRHNKIWLAAITGGRELTEAIDFLLAIHIGVSPPACDTLRTP